MNHNRLVKKIILESADSNKLRLTDQNLDAFKKNVDKYKNIEELIYNVEYSKELPLEVKKLSNLKVLVIESETKMPDWIGDLTSLQELDMYNTGQTILPVSLSNLKGLIFLGLSGNALEEIPEWIGKLSNLQALLLHDNKLTSLPNSFSELLELTNLTLDGNEINTVGKTYVDYEARRMGLKIGNKIWDFIDSSFDNEGVLYPFESTPFNLVKFAKDNHYARRVKKMYLMDGPNKDFAFALIAEKLSQDIEL